MSNIDIEDPKTKQEMLDAVREICEQFRIMDDARDQVKEIIIAAHAALDIPKPMVRKVARLYHKKNASAVEAENAAIKSLYTIITS
jgi:histone H3/H4